MASHCHTPCVQIPIASHRRWASSDLDISCAAYSREMTVIVLKTMTLYANYNCEAGAPCSEGRLISILYGLVHQHTKLPIRASTQPLRSSRPSKTKANFPRNSTCVVQLVQIHNICAVQLVLGRKPWLFLGQKRRSFTDHSMLAYLVP